MNNNNNNNNSSMIKYGHEVLGRAVTVQFRVGKKKANRTYRGTILRVQISMDNEDEVLEEGPAFFNDSNNQVELQVLHEVLFTDGEEHWLDLAEVEAAGRLTWCDSHNNKTKNQKKTTTTPSLQREVSTANSTSSGSSSDGDHSAEEEKMPEATDKTNTGAAEETNTTARSTTTTTTTTTNGAERRDSGIRVSLKKAKKMRKIMLARLVAAQSDPTDSSQLGPEYHPAGAASSAAAQVVTPGADQPAVKKKKKKRSHKEDSQDENHRPTVRRSAKKKRKTMTSSSNKPSTSKKRTNPTGVYVPREKRPGSGPQWVEQMYDWMVNIHGSTPKTALRLRKEVLKLANGEGVNHRQWEEAGVAPFYEGIPVSILTSDLDQLQTDSVVHQQKHGKDPSHGWLLNGPISKLKAFQEYLLTL